MRLWSVHPQYFDRQALTACWREGLLAQQVLDQPNRGYGSHPQLERFRERDSPAAAIGAFLTGIVDEADARGYRFQRDKIRARPVGCDPIPVTAGQLRYEWTHLLDKLSRRSPAVFTNWEHVVMPTPHPLFRTVDGPIASWERPKTHGET